MSMFELQMLIFGAKVLSQAAMVLIGPRWLFLIALGILLWILVVSWVVSKVAKVVSKAAFRIRDATDAFDALCNQ
jgi:hypothetical protein